MMLVAATRSWADDLEEALIEELGEATRRRALPALRRRLPGRLPRRLGGALGARRHRAHRGAAGCRRARHQPLPAARGGAAACCARSCSAPGRPLMLSDVLPLFENMGVEVADERPYPIVPRGRDGVWIYDFGLTYSGEGDLDAGGVRESFQDTFVRAWRGEVENDAYNRLVLGAALTWREITVLRAIGKYLRQARITYSDRYVEQALVAHPEIARLLVALFQARFDPRRTDREDAEEVAERIERGDRRGREPRPGPDPADVPRRDPARSCARTTSRPAPPRRRATSRSSSTRRSSAGCRSRARASRSSSTRRAPRACTCAAARWRAAASAGRTGARTSAPRCSA